MRKNPRAGPRVLASMGKKGKEPEQVEGKWLHLQLVTREGWGLDTAPAMGGPAPWMV